uniref:DUF632 domain-containing protein n=1 Tax=Aegilops tauschii TaxID=37682 RepID=M8BVP2_AEGTA
MASIATEDEEIIPEPEDEKYVPASPPRPPSSPPPQAVVPPREEYEEEEPRTPEMVTPPPSLPPKAPGQSKKKKGKGKGKGKNKSVHHQHTESAPPVTVVGGWGKAGKVVPAEVPRVDLLQVLAEIDDRFLKASESAGEVSKALEANRMHYHSNFADTRDLSGWLCAACCLIIFCEGDSDVIGFFDGTEGIHYHGRIYGITTIKVKVGTKLSSSFMLDNSNLYGLAILIEHGHIDHSARVMKIITWNRSFRSMQNGDDGKDEFENDEEETLATVIDKILAWEKKLYDEVKAGEIMKLEYQRKVALLNRQKRNNAAVEVLEKTKAAVTHLHTRYIVDMQSMDSTVSEIQHLRDNQLYPKLLDLADRLAKMWEDMHMHHANQLKTVLDLKSVDISDSSIETSAHHHSHTRQLHDIVDKWNTNFSDLMSYQKEYINALYSWLKLNLIPIESSLKEKVASPPRVQQPPVKALLQAWNEQLAKLPDDLARHAIVSFRAVLETILGVQDEELKKKEACEQIHKEYVRKARAFEEWYHKHGQRRTFDDPESGEGTSQKDAISEKRFAVESLKSKLDNEVEAHNKLSKQVREKSLSILRAHLPELFRALTDFSHATADMHSKLRLNALMQDQGSGNN